jgi:hypothetical protein
MGKPQVFWGFSAHFYSPIGVRGRGDQWGGGTVLRTDDRHLRRTGCAAVAKDSFWEAARTHHMFRTVQLLYIINLSCLANILGYLIPLSSKPLTRYSRHARLTLKKSTNTGSCITWNGRNNAPFSPVRCAPQPVETGYFSVGEGP